MGLCTDDLGSDGGDVVVGGVEIKEQLLVGDLAIGAGIEEEDGWAVAEPCVVAPEEEEEERRRLLPQVDSSAGAPPPALRRLRRTVNRRPCWC